MKNFQLEFSLEVVVALKKMRLKQVKHELSKTWVQIKELQKVRIPLENEFYQLDKQIAMIERRIVLPPFKPKAIAKPALKGSNGKDLTKEQVNTLIDQLKQEIFESKLKAQREQEKNLFVMEGEESEESYV